MSIGKNTAFGIGTDVLVFGLGIIVSVVLTRSLGPEQRGVYVLLITTNILVASMAHLSLEIAFSTLLAQGRYTLGAVNGVAISMALLLGMLGAALISLAFLFLQESIFQNVPYIYLLVALLLTPITMYQIYWNYMMMGLGHVRLMNKFNLAVNLLTTLLMILAIGVLRLGIAGFLAVWAFSSVAGVTATLTLAWRIERPAWPPSRRLLKELLSFGLRSHGRNVAHQLFLRFDMYAVNALVGTAGVGFYSLSTSLAEKLWLPINSIHAASLGKITQLSHDESALLTAKVARAAVLMMLTVAIPFAVLSPWLIPLLYGPEFAASVLPLVILLVGTIGFAVMLVVNNYILGRMERPGLLSIITLLQLVVSIPLYLLFIFWLGLVGAAIASTLTYLFSMSCTLYIFARDSGLPIQTALVPRASDFVDYARILRSILRQVPVLGSRLGGGQA